jgi:hypothetical protein
MTESLLKFIKQDERSQLFESIVEKEIKRKSSNPVCGSFDPSRITECSRRISYRSAGIKTSIGSYMERQTNNAVKAKWLSLFDACPSIKVLEKNLVVADSKFNVTGSIDVILSIDEIYVTQIKPVSDSEFKKISKNGVSRKDVIEFIIYLWLSEIKNGMMIYDNKNNGGYLIFHVQPYTPIIKSVKAKCSNLMQHKLAEQLPKRPYKNLSSQECSTCEFRIKCWEKEGKNG